MDWPEVESMVQTTHVYMCRLWIDHGDDGNIDCDRGSGADGGSGDFGGGPDHVMTMNWQLRVHAARNIRHSLLS